MAEISLQITGDNAPLLAALSEARGAVTTATESMKSSFEGFSRVFEKVTGAMAAFGAVLAGGRMFKEAIDATVNLTKESVSLGRQFGISATEASDLKVALSSVFVTQDQLSAAGNAVTRSLRSHEVAFKSLGVATRDQNGDYRNTIDIILDVNDKLSALKEGTDRNVEGQRIYGKSWQEIAPSIKLTTSVMEEAKKRAEELGLEVGTKDVAATKAYRTAMVEVHEVMEAAWKVVGDALLPVLTSLGEWFGSIGPQVVGTFRQAIGTLAIAFEVLNTSANLIFDFLSTAFAQLVILATTVASAVSRAFHLDFSGARDAWNNGMAEFNAIGNKWLAKTESDAKASVDRLKKIFAIDFLQQKDPSNAPLPKPHGGGNAPQDDADAEKRKRQLEELADFAIELDTRVTQEHNRFLEQQRAADDKKTNDDEKQLEELSNYAQDLDTRVTNEHAKAIADRNKADAKATEDQLKRWQSMTSVMQGSLASAFRGMLSGGESFGQGMRNVVISIADEFLKMATKNIATMVMQAAMGNTLRAAEIRKDAGAGAAAAYKAVVGIPFLGPFLAPAAAAVAYAGILAFDSAEQGYNIPPGVNPLTQLHENEMVLPEPIADTIRNAMKSGGGSGEDGSHSTRGPVHTIRAQNIGGGRAIIYHDELANAIKQLGHQFKLG